MKYYIVLEDYGIVREYDTEKETIEFLAKEVEDEYGCSPEDAQVLKGEQFQFVPPSSHGSLTKC